MDRDPITSLRHEMAKRNLAAYMVPTADFHNSEYVGDYFKARAWLTGFTGSAGTLVVTQSEAALWTDGRYFLQAAQELYDGVMLMRMGEPDVPAIPEWLKLRLSPGDRLGLDGRTVSAYDVRELIKSQLPNKLEVESCDLITDIWTDRPPMSEAPAFLLDLRYAGTSAGEKLAELREDMRRENVEVHVLTSLTDIAWLLNLRGGDISYVPVLQAYAIIELERAFLFTDRDKLTPEVAAHLSALGISVMPYNGVYAFAQRYDEGISVMADGRNMNYDLFSELCERAIVIDVPNPTTLKKAVKNQTELDNMAEAHEKDGVAMVKLMYWLKRDPSQKTELSVAQRADELRREQGALQPSFATIAACGAHGAIVHYTPTPESDAALDKAGFLLVDSGGQYLEGTTDVTRTYALGPLTEDQRKHYALVLVSMLSVMDTEFRHGCKGSQIDIVARRHFWAEGIDYKHGTGHGVGYLSSVHEGPNSFRWQSESCVLEAGMITSDEPGIYIPGEYGIRTENLIICREGEHNEYGRFMHFEPLTLAPIDLDAVDPSLLDDTERGRLNEYHALVFEKLSPYFQGEELEFLREYTREI